MRFDSGNEALTDETGRLTTPDGLSEAFFLNYGAADSERMATNAGLSRAGRVARGVGRVGRVGIDPNPPGSLYSDFIRNAAGNGLGRVGRVGRVGLGFSASEVLADPSGFGYVPLDDGSWVQPDTGSSITTDGRVIDPTGQISGATITGVGNVTYDTRNVNSATTPGGVSGFLTQFVKSFPSIMQGLTTAQLSQINIQRMQAGLPPLTTGQVLGVTGALPAISSGMIMLGLGVLAFALIKK